MAGPRVDQVNVVVADVAGATAFLEALGVEFEASSPEWAEWDAHHRAVPTVGEGFDADLDSSVFAAWWGGVPEGFNGVVVNLRVAGRDEVDALHERALVAGGESRKAPWDAFWDSRYAVVAGPGPIHVGIMSEPDPGRGTPPPAIDEFA